MNAKKSSSLIFIALILGIGVGYACNVYAPTPEAAKEIAGYFGIVTDVFLRLIKMVIAPLVFATLVAGLANIGDSRTVGRIGVKALGWFMAASLASLFIGLHGGCPQLVRTPSVPGGSLAAAGLRGRKRLHCR